jgi:hypothetical protein
MNMQNSDKTHTTTTSLPEETHGVIVSGHLLIRDKTLQQTLVNKRTH